MGEVISLMGELDPEIVVTPEMVRRMLESASSHFFAIMAEDHIIACATLCVFDSPTGRKASVEDVVVNSKYRGQGLGKMLMQNVIAFAKAELKTVDLHLTSRPHRVAANGLYQSLGFGQKETNVYVLKLREEGR